MRYQELFPVPSARIAVSDELLAESVFRWAEERVVSKRRKLGESFDELLTPALLALLDEVGLRHLVWSGGETSETTTSPTTLVVALEQVGRADLGLAAVLAGHFALQRVLVRCHGGNPSLEKGFSPGPPSRKTSGNFSPSVDVDAGVDVDADVDEDVDEPARNHSTTTTTTTTTTSTSTGRVKRLFKSFKEGVRGGNFSSEKFSPRELPLRGWSELGALVLPDYGPASPAFDGLGAPAVAMLGRGTVVIESRRPVRPQHAGADAGWFGVACELEGEPALVVVPGDAAGALRGGEVPKKTGLRASRDAELTLAGVELPEDHVVLVGAAPYSVLVSDYRLGCAAGCVGALLAAHAILRDWSEDRVIKGQGRLLRDNPLAAALMGRIGARLATSRLLVHGLADLLGTGSSDALDGAGSTGRSATTLAVCSAVLDAAASNLDETMELMASAGYATEWQLERSWRDVKTLQTVLGPAPARLAELAAHSFGCEVR